MTSRWCVRKRRPDLGDVLPVADAAVQERREQLRLLLGRPVRLEEAEVALDDGVAVVRAVAAELAAPREAVGADLGRLAAGGLAILRGGSKPFKCRFLLQAYEVIALLSTQPEQNLN